MARIWEIVISLDSSQWGNGCLHQSMKLDLVKYTRPTLPYSLIPHKLIDLSISMCEIRVKNCLISPKKT
jgi:hypothetical protein